MAIARLLNRKALLIIGIGLIVSVVFIFKGKNTPSPIEEIGSSLLSKVMLASGGKENYKDIRTITFTKVFHLYAEDGTVEIDRKEQHTYDFTAGTSRHIQWQEREITKQLIEKDTALFQIIDGRRDTTVTRAQLQNKLNAATFVLGLPYTLDNDGSTKTYNGILDFEGTPAHELEVAFTNSTDVWKLYYKLDTLAWLGYWVKTSDHYSLVINEEMTEVKGLTFSRKRKSYRTDAQKKRRYLRADYLYSDFKVD